MVNPQALVIEDEPDLAVLFGEAVGRAGFDVQIVSQGSAARERLLSVLPTLVVLDLHLPGVSGTDILHVIRSEPRLSGTRVIIASADDRSIKLLEDEADLALVKPITFSQLRDLASRFHPGLTQRDAA